jgi:hypothetical protein
MFGTEPVAFYSTHLITPPSEFRDVWHDVSESHRRGDLAEDEVKTLCDVAAVLVFSDIHNEDHFQDALDLAKSIGSLGELAPPIILVPHSESLEAAMAHVDEEKELLLYEAALQGGFDDQLVGQPAGTRLASEACSKIMQQFRLVDRAINAMKASCESADRIDRLQDSLSFMVWKYLNVRLNAKIPDIDYSLKAGRPDKIANLWVGRQLGAGSFGVVCKLVNNQNEASGQVVKMIEKKPITNLYGLANLKKVISVSKVLSSEAMAHVNIVQFYQVYQTETHILLRMEDGGDRDLYKRLKQREADRPLGVNKAASIISQLMDSLCHLHLKAGIVHRDIKPENIIITEKADGSIVPKLTDFDTSRFARAGHTRCDGIVGTFPFMAPETAFGAKYDPFATDVWSMGLVFLEVLCKTDILCKALSLRPSSKVQTRPARRSLEKSQLETIHAYFSQPDKIKNLLNMFCRLELAALKDNAKVLLGGMLNAVPENRWETSVIEEARANLFQQIAA